MIDSNKVGAGILEDILKLDRGEMLKHVDMAFRPENRKTLKWPSRNLAKA